MARHPSLSTTAKRCSKAYRNHSLCAETDSLPTTLEVTATAEGGVIMGVRHKTLPIEGVQFHPESVLTPEGDTLMTNFMRMERP